MIPAQPIIPSATLLVIFAGVTLVFSVAVLREMRRARAPIWPVILVLTMALIALGVMAGVALDPLAWIDTDEPAYAWRGVDQ